MGMAATADRPTTRRFTSEEVWRMVEIGLIEPDEPYELIDGELLYVSPQGETHAKVVARLTMLLVRMYDPHGYVVRPQLPTGGIVDSIPEPDLAVVPPDVAEQDTHPRPDQALLLVEAAVTSHARDGRKGQIYAAAAAPVYWIVDVPADLVRVHRGPRPDGTWREVTEVPIDGMLALPGIDVEVPVTALLRPPAPR